MIDLRHGDCLEIMKDIPDKSINLVLIDPPYNISKAEWDKWKTVEDYVAFMGGVFIECQRVLKDNGSFYFFHNDFMQIVELQNYINKNTNFIFKQFLVWNKRFEGSKRKYYFDNVISTNSARNHRQLSEYCLFYTFQDDTGLNEIYDNEECFLSIKKYLREERKKVKKAGFTDKDLRNMCGVSLKGGGLLGHYWGRSQWIFPIEKHYLKLQETTFFQKPYKELRQEYEDLRYTFHNLKEHHDVLDYDVAKKQGHITPKPTDLLEYLIKTSSNEGDLVLDCFMGSGSTGVACKNTNRRFIGIELDETYFNLAKNRIEEERRS